MSLPVDGSRLIVMQYTLHHSEVGIGTDRRLHNLCMRPTHGRLQLAPSVFHDVHIMHDANSLDVVDDDDEAALVQ